MENNSPSIIDFGISEYSLILQKQTELFEKILEEKKSHRKDARDYVLIGEHHPVITLGRRANEENLLVNSDFLKNTGIEIFKIGRGGDITYHNPGQIILYPILDLDKYHLGVKDYVCILEKSVIELLAGYGIKGERIEGATGVWLDKGTPYERKICAIGIKCSHFCTMHGLALNVKNDLSGFSYINPCGFQDKGVTSMEYETNQKLDIIKIKEQLLHIFLSLIFPFKESLDFPE